MNLYIWMQIPSNKYSFAHEYKGHLYLVYFYMKERVILLIYVALIKILWYNIHLEELNGMIIEFDFCLIWSFCEKVILLLVKLYYIRLQMTYIIDITTILDSNR